MPLNRIKNELTTPYFQDYLPLTAVACRMLICLPSIHLSVFTSQCWHSIEVCFTNCHTSHSHTKLIKIIFQQNPPQTWTHITSSKKTPKFYFIIFYGKGLMIHPLQADSDGAIGVCDNENYSLTESDWFHWPVEAWSALDVRDGSSQVRIKAVRTCPSDTSSRAARHSARTASADCSPQTNAPRSSPCSGRHPASLGIES